MTNQKSPGIRLKYKIEINRQAKRYLDSIRNIRQGFYQKLRLYVLDFVPDSFSSRIVYLPKVKSLSLTKNLIKESHTLSTCEQEAIEAKAIEIFEKYKEHMDKQAEIVQLKIDHFLEMCDRYVDSSDIKELIIYPTAFGTMGQYHKDNDVIRVFPRFDMTGNNILELILLALVHRRYFLTSAENNVATEEQQNTEWHRKQKLATAIAKQPEFNKLLDDRADFVKVIEHHTKGNLAQRSCEYLQKLGVELRCDSILEDSKSKLTEQEYDVLRLLYRSKGEIVEYDAIADTMWGDEAVDKFSLSAISKTIERIRNKVDGHCHAPLIHTQRGKGYIMFAN